MATKSKKTTNTTTKKLSDMLILAGLSAVFTMSTPASAQEAGLSNTSPASGDLSYEEAMKALEQTKQHSDMVQDWGERRTVEVPKGADPQQVIEKELKKIPPITEIGVDQQSDAPQPTAQSQAKPQTGTKVQPALFNQPTATQVSKEDAEGPGLIDVDTNQAESTKKVEEPSQAEAAPTATKAPADSTNTAVSAPENSTPAAETSAPKAGATRSASGIENYNAAVKAHLTGKLDEAIKEYREALVVNPNLGQAHCNLGLIFNQQHKFAEALAEFQKALAIDPKDAITYNGIGAALRAQKDLDGAIKNWQTAVTYNPHLATAHYNLGTAYELKKDFDKALESYRQATASDFRLGEAYFRMGIIMRDRNLKSEAKEQFNQALKVAPGAEYSKKAREFLAALEQGKN